jgi:hypothetical protein
MVLVCISWSETLFNMSKMHGVSSVKHYRNILYFANRIYGLNINMGVTRLLNFYFNIFFE